MARRRGNFKEVGKAKWTKAFTQEETKAIDRALGMLYRRALCHLVAGKYKIPRLVTVYQSLIPPDVNELLRKAHEMMAAPQNGYWADFEVQVRVGSCATLEAKSKAQFLPRTGQYEPANPMDTTLIAYAADAHECRAQWRHIAYVFHSLNQQTKRATAAYYWPCSLALMKLGGVAPVGLDNITRPGSVPAELVVSVRDTSATVMQHMMLPAVDNMDFKGMYEGDYETGLGAYLFLDNNDTDEFGATIWPLKD